MLGSSISTEDRTILVEALAVLLRERSNAHRLAIEIAAARGERGPDISDYGVLDILRLSRAIAPDGSNIPEDLAVLRLTRQKRTVANGRRTDAASIGN